MEIIFGVFLIIAAFFYGLRKYFCGSKYTKNTRIDGKIVIITGANTGLGFENAIDLAKRGGKIYIACRDIKRGHEALIKIKNQSRSENVHFLQLDLASMKSIKKFVNEFKSLETKLDILVNNAGIITDNQKSFTEDGFETTMGVNHLGTFYLTHLLLDILKKSSPSRIVIVASVTHKFAKLNRNNLMSEKEFDESMAYFNSKLANILFTRELAKVIKGTGVTVNCCHPGVVNTDVFRNYSWIKRFLKTIFIQPFMKTPHEGAQTQIRLAVDPELEHVSGKYFSDCKEKKPAIKALDDDLAKWLWEESMKLLKLN